MKNQIQRLLHGIVLGVLFVSICTAGVITNEDVIKMSTAKVSDDVILVSIANSEPKFDTSTDGLIALAKANVSSKVISAMIQRAAGGGGANAAASPATAAAAPQAAQAANTLSPSDVVMIDGDKSTVLKYSTPQVRTAARGFGFGGMASYSVLRGSSAMVRTTNKQPSFLVSVPERAEPESYLTVASFAVRRNDTREVMIGGGYMSYSTGIHPDRVMHCACEKAADQSRAQKGFIIYKVTPKTGLRVGEYAVILYTGEMSNLVSAWFAGGGNSYFDFGVDP